MTGSETPKAETSSGRFLEVDDLAPGELNSILKLAHQVKAEPALLTDALAGKQLALIFEKHSTRTRVSLEVGINSMGVPRSFFQRVRLSSAGVNRLVIRRGFLSATSTRSSRGSIRMSSSRRWRR